MEKKYSILFSEFCSLMRYLVSCRAYIKHIENATINTFPGKPTMSVAIGNLCVAAAVFEHIGLLGLVEGKT